MRARVKERKEENTRKGEVETGTGDKVGEKGEEIEAVEGKEVGQGGRMETGSAGAL